jgi:hypothetical protein
MRQCECLNPNFIGSDGCSAFHMAVAHQVADIVSFMLNCVRVDPNILDEDG